MYLTDELLEKIKKLKNKPRDPYLTVFGFDRKLLLVEEDVWTYTAGFCFKREEKENAYGKMRFFYFPNNGFGIHVELYDEENSLAEGEIKYIQEKFQEGYYEDIQKDHLSFFEALNTLFIEKQTPTWGSWEKETYKPLKAKKNEHHYKSDRSHVVL